METNEYLEVFIEESKEHIQSLNDHLLELEKNPSDLSMVNEIFRSAHTLKGMSATMGYQDLANLTHKMENVLDAVRNNKLAVNTEILDVVLEAVDQLEEMVLDIASGGEGSKDVELLVEQLDAIENGEEIPAATKKVDDSQEEVSHSSAVNLASTLDEFERTVLLESKEQGFHNLELSISLREDCLLKAARVYMVFEILEQSGEVIKSSPTVQELEDENFDLSFTVLLVTKEDPQEIEKKVMKVSEVDKVQADLFTPGQPTKNGGDEPAPASNGSQTAVAEAPVKKEADKKASANKAPVNNKTIRVNIDRLDALMNLFEELVIDRGRLEQIADSLKHNELQETVERMTRISGDLQNIILNMRMVPIDQVFNRFPRMVRQLAKDLGKQINLEIEGAETELDRTVIDEIGDPLVHLIRNALDHGVEQPDIREQKGKPREGSLKLYAYHSGNHVFIEISDDGAGINRDKVINKAISNGVITSEQSETLTEKQVFQLIMESGFSTADKISDVSGRGVGLDVVKNTIESLGGNITIDSKLDQGSVFSIQLPLTLSIISVMLVEIEEEKYAVPLSSIIETAVIKKSNIMSAHNKKVIDFRGRVVPLINLKDVFEVPGDNEEDDYYSIVIIRKGDKMAGLIVDSFIGQQEVVLKSLGNYLTDVFAISGATILGDGQVALIIDSNSLIM
ncbi:chemotaxis protein CheA [Sediminibacillus albus]|uniref:Chemotaxis protein CheA n=1 Tax=Sediminibacillus albus TaxID=407036 RepID=A0A1G8W1U6_9BACI|nr:chemotaxis protein CheA [Sediminibacillus albus]SDJ72033.1 two-component system, chemotaxis family, sensor kinase CheA [Sediminibacillus albus]